MATGGLLGREPEIEMLDRLVAGVPDRGASLVLRGDPGVGKSALLDVVARQVGDLGWVVLRTSGAPSERQLPLAALHKLVHPVMDRVERLGFPQRDAIRAAFGLAMVDPPEIFHLALAVLDLLAEVAAVRPLVVLIDDLQWIDRSSAEVLVFIARRVEADPILVLAATRPSAEDPARAGALPELVVAPLSDAASGSVLDLADAQLSPQRRQTVLDAAAGNPLALLELPHSLREDDAASDLLPLTDRLERAFAERALTLPANTGDLLLLAALNDSSSLGEVLAAQSVMGSAKAAVDDLEAAVSAGLVTVDQSALRFRHPLVRSAIYQSASLGRRQAGHRALAEVLGDDPDRRVWHRAAAVVGADEEVASELEQAAQRAQQRGAVAAAASALERAAALSASNALRSRRLVRAAELSYDVGQVHLSGRLLNEAASVALDGHDRLRFEAVRELSDAGMNGGVTRVDALIRFGGQAEALHDTDLALQFLLRAATRCWHLDLGPEVERRVIHATERLPLLESDPRRLVIHAYASPFDQGNEVMELLATRPPQPTDDPQDLLLLGHAAACTGAFAEAETYCGAAADGLRREGRLAPLGQALSLVAWSALRRSRWHVAVPAAEECVRLADETGQPVVQVAGLAAQAMIASIRGDHEATATLAARAENLGIANRISVGLALIQTARGMAAAGAGRPVEAFEHLHRLYRDDDPAHQRMQACWAIGSLAEAATQCGQEHAAAAELDQLEPFAARTSAPGVHIALRHARALLAGADEAEVRFHAALEVDLNDWPFEHGRLLLSYGRWLRRQRRVRDSRQPLRAACEQFDRTGALPWADLARNELRAAGENRSVPERKAWDTLSPQEMQVAQLVVEGLGNKEIGERMYLSHRTISSHLYRIFPKLGVTSRAQLAIALSGIAAPGGPGPL